MALEFLLLSHGFNFFLFSSGISKTLSVVLITNEFHEF
jgi:hypothetical protein